MSASNRAVRLIANALRGPCKSKTRKKTTRCRVETLEDRLTPAGAFWEGYAAGPQHTALSTVASQPLDAIRWQTPVDLLPQYSGGGSLLIHYGSPSVTTANTVIVPVKTGTTNGFKVNAFDGSTGAILWTQTTAYQLPPSAGWIGSYGPVLTTGGRYYYPGNGGTINFTDDPDGTGALAGQFALEGLANYNANPAAYNNTVFISTPLTADAAGNIYFGYQVTGANPLGLTSGLARIAPDGTATRVTAQTLLGNANSGDRVVYNCAPALSNNGLTLYVAANGGTSGVYSVGALVALDSTSLAVQQRVPLTDPTTGSPSYLPDIGTASPTVGPDGDVYFGVLENPFPHNHYRGWLLHFSGDLLTTKTPGAFGWDDSASIVPSTMVPTYEGSSTYLVMTKYNNYAGGGGDGVNKIAILDPNASMIDPISGGTVMKEVLSIAGPTPDPDFISGHPNAVREWCINTAVVDPATDSVLVNNEDGKMYRWDLSTNTFTQSVVLTSGIGEAYTPTIMGADGAVYAINNAILFALGDFQPSVTDLMDTPNPVTISNTVSLTVTVTGPFWLPTGTITFFDGATPISGPIALNGSGVAGMTIDTLSAGTHDITAQYSGDDHFASSTSLVKHQIVNKVVTTTTLTTSNTPTTDGQNVILTATVDGTPINWLPPLTGIVYFYDGVTLLGAGSISGTQAVLNVSNLSVGSHSLTAQYQSDPYYEVSTSPAITQQVNGLPTLGNVPVLAQIDEEHTLAFTASVANPGTPAFSLIGAPTGATIDPMTGAFSWQPTEAQGPGTFAFTVRLIDGATTDDRPITVMVGELNAAPVLTGVPTNVVTVPGSPVTFTALASDADFINTLPNALSFSLVGAPANASIDPDTGAFIWTPDETNALGLYSFKVRVADDGVPSLHDTNTIVVTLKAADLINTGTSTDLLIGGTGGNDTITVNPSKSGTQLIVKLGKSTLGTFTLAPTAHIVVHGLGGNDKITIASKVTNAAELFGGSGNDMLTGGSGSDRLFGEAGDDKLIGGKGNNLLVGGDGNDKLTGGADLDVLIGGAGSDKLAGGKADDLLIAGFTNFDTNLSALDKIFAEWTGNLDYSVRITHLTTGGGANGTTLLTTSTVHDDQAKDSLIGAAGNDWFLVSALDKLDLKTGEQRILIV